MKPLDRSSKFLHVPDPTTIVKRRLGCHLLPVHLSPKWGLHVHTVDQELRTLQNRHMFETPKATKEGLQLMKEEYARMAAIIGVVPRATHKELMHNKLTRKLRRYNFGAKEYFSRGLDHRDAKCKMMMS